MPKAANGPMKPNMCARNEANSNPPMFPNTINQNKILNFKFYQQQTLVVPRLCFDLLYSMR